VSLVYGKGNWEKDRDDIIDLCGTWWEDSLFFKLYGIKYNVDVDMFNKVKEYGALIYTVGRDENGRLISCYVGSKSPYMFNPSVLAATEIVWCIRKENRKFKHLVRLIYEIEKLMTNENVIQWNLNVSNEEIYAGLEKFLTSRRYDFMDKCFTKLKEAGNG